MLAAFDEAGWTITDPPTYYRVLCPCGDHMRMIHLTPSGGRYGKNALHWLLYKIQKDLEPALGKKWLL